MHPEKILTNQTSHCDILGRYSGSLNTPVHHTKSPTGFLLRLENLEKWEGIFQSGNFEQTGKVRENLTKYWKTQGISDKYNLLFFSDI